MTIPPNPKSGFYKKNQLLSLKKKLQNFYNLDIQNHTKKIYVSRKKASVRKIENETEVINLLKKHGFEIVNAEELNFKQQVELFSQCKFLISIHGAALTNCLFMPERSKVIELYREKSNKLSEMNYCYQRQTTALNINHNYFYCKTGENLGTHIDKINLNVNLQALEEVILS